jgi:hypothetical protein
VNSRECRKAPASVLETVSYGDTTLRVSATLQTLGLQAGMPQAQGTHTSSGGGGGAMAARADGGGLGVVGTGGSGGGGGGVDDWGDGGGIRSST